MDTEQLENLLEQLCSKNKKRKEKREMEALNTEQREEVQNRYPELTFPDPIKEPLWFGKRPEFRVEGKRAIVDQKTNNVFGICSDQYQIIHYQDIIKMVETTVHNLPEFGKIDVVPTLIAEGGKMKIMATMNDTSYEIKKGDVVHPTITIRTSYDLGWKLLAKFGAFRLVCSNGMIAEKVFSKFAKRHILSLDPEMLTKSIQDGMSVYSDQVGLWKEWAEKKLFADTYDAMWEALPFSEGEKEKIEKLPEVSSKLLLPDAIKSGEATVWDFHSVVTQWTTHNIASETRKADIESQITRVFETIH